MPEPVTVEEARRLREGRAIDRARAILSEHFTGYLVVAGTDLGIQWRMSDSSFAIGSALRLQQRITERDSLDLHAEYEGAGD